MAEALDADPELALRAVAVERVGVDQPAQGPAQVVGLPRAPTASSSRRCSTPVTAADDERFAGLGVAPDVVRRLPGEPSPTATGRSTTATRGSARSASSPPSRGSRRAPKEYKKNPDAYPGSIREASQLVRIALTGSTRSPNLPDVARTLGTDEVLRRLRAVR